MALNPTTLGTGIAAAFAASGAVPGPALNALALALANAIITEITTNGVVLPTLLIAPTGGGPVTGTGKVT